MRFSQWRDSLKIYQATVEKAQEQLDQAKQDRDTFLRESVGFASGDMATVEGTSRMISKIIDMKSEEPKVE